MTECITDNIESGSHLWSDCWAGYNTAQLNALGYTHSTVNHSNQVGSRFIAPDDTHTNRIESSWRPFKQWMRNYRMNSNDDDQFILLLCEYYWRRLCRIRNIDKFNDLLRGIKQLGTLSSNENILFFLNPTFFSTWRTAEDQPGIAACRYRYTSRDCPNLTLPRFYLHAEGSEVRLQPGVPYPADSSSSRFTTYYLLRQKMHGQRRQQTDFYQCQAYLV